MTRPFLLALFLAGALPTTLIATDPASARPQPARRFDVGHFSAVELDASDAVRVTQGDTAVTATGDPRVLDALLVEVRGDTLHIGRRPGRWRDRGAVVSVSVPALRAAAVRGSGSLSLSQAGVRSVQLAVSGSGSIVATGTAQSAAIDVGGSGNVDARALRTRDLTVGVGGSGSVRASASGTATVNVGGSGSAVVTGGPRCTVSRAGSGTVRCG